MKIRKEKVRLAVLVNPIKFDGYGESVGWDLEIVGIDPSDDKPRNLSRSDINGLEIFDDLKIRVHLSWHNHQWQVPTYGWYEYRNVYAVDAQCIEVLARGLKKCERIVKNFPIQPITFAQYVVLLAKGLGVTECVRCSGRERSMYTETDWHVRKIDSVTSMIEDAMDKFRASVCPSAAA